MNLFFDMRPQVVSTCERNFIVQSFVQDLRIDGRKCEDYRQLRFFVGKEFGSCLAILGETKVLTQVSCSIVKPKASRPNEGEIYVNVEMSPMAAANHEIGRLGNSGIELTRILERLLRESSCIDVESLCLKAGENVWQIRIDVHILDHDGSLVDCASVSAITAVAHFRRPDCSVTGESLTIYDITEREPVPLNVCHMPCASRLVSSRHDFSESIVVDLTEREENCTDGTILIAANKRQEICALHCNGTIAMQKQLIMKCTAKALQRANDINDQIKAVIAADREKRAQRNGQVDGFVGCTLVT